MDWTWIFEVPWYFAIFFSNIASVIAWFVILIVKEIIGIADSKIEIWAAVVVNIIYWLLYFAMGV